jgi:hypothetical protein
MILLGFFFFWFWTREIIRFAELKKRAHGSLFFYLWIE